MFGPGAGQQTVHSGGPEARPAHGWRNGGAGESRAAAGAQEVPYRPAAVW